jgi:hypothetical protein
MGIRVGRLADPLGAAGVLASHPEAELDRRVRRQWARADPLPTGDGPRLGHLSDDRR